MQVLTGQGEAPSCSSPYLSKAITVMHRPSPLLVFLLFCSTSLLTADSPPFANWLEQAQRDRDWATVAEVAARWLKADPNQRGLLEDIARARLYQGDLKRAEAQLDRWEKTLATPTASSLALRGELAFAKDRYKSNKAREYWMLSYASKATADVARRLTDPQLWHPSERKLFEQWVLRISKTHSSAQTLTLATETHLRHRDWQALAQVIASLNEIATRSAISAAIRLQTSLDQRDQLAIHDQRVADHATGSAFAKRASYFINQGWTQLALEDATQSLAIAPRAVFPKIIQARCLMAQGESDQSRELQVVTYKEAAILTPEQQASLLKLDALASQAIIDPQIHKQRAHLLQELDQPALSLLDLSIYQSSQPEDPDAWVLAGKVQLDLKEPAKAKAAFLHSRNLGPNHAPAWQGLAETALQQADYETAEACYQWLSDRDPSNVQITEALQLCQSRRQR